MVLSDLDDVFFRTFWTKNVAVWVLVMATLWFWSTWKAKIECSIGAPEGFWFEVGVLLPEGDEGASAK